MTATRKSSNGTARLIIGIVSAAFMAAGVAATLMSAFFYSGSDASAHVATFEAGVKRQDEINSRHAEEIKTLKVQSQETHTGVQLLLDRIPARK